jgi:hypothetical protein
MNNTLKIMAWNANGLPHRQQELEIVLHSERIDVCLVSETHLTNQSFIKIKGYKFYHTVHPDNTGKGGSAVIVRENVQHTEELEYRTEEIQATVISLKLRRYTVAVTGIYCPPKHALKCQDYLKFFKHLGKRFIIGGDFNAKNTHWGSRLTTTKGRELLSAMQENKCQPLSNGKPTYWPTDLGKIPDLIDFFIIKNISTNYIKIEDSFDLSSDHSPIVLTLSENVIEREPNPVLCNKHTNWEHFRLLLEDRINLNVPLQNEWDIDKEVEHFVTSIQQSAWECTPEIKRRTVGHNYPIEIRKILSDKRKARRKWQQTRDPRDKTQFNNLTQQLRREIKEVKNETFTRYLNELSNDSSTDYSLWKATRCIKRPTIQNAPIKQINGTWARDNQQKSDTFAAHLENIFQPNDSPEADVFQLQTVQDYEVIEPVTVKEVKNMIKNKINSRKAPGFDLITGEVLKQLPRKAVVKLTNLINSAFRLQYIPDYWKIAEVIMILKPGKSPYNVSSYRPISLLPVISKLFEKLFLKRMKLIIERKNLIPNHQFGFREKHTTIEQVHRITNVIEMALEEKKVCSAIFLDVAQAFDKVWHEGLLHKLRTMLPIQYTNILESYLSGRYFRVKQEESYSELKEIRAGVPQGSVLGPVLYLMYTSDLPELQNNTIATFADDTAILTVGSSNREATEKLQAAVDGIQKWTEKWRITINETKSVHVNFTNKKCDHIPININRQVIPYANEAKYLGMTLDTRLRWKAHVKKKRNELGLRYSKIYWLIGRNSSLSTYNKLLIYKQILKPIWMYGIQLWGCASQSNIGIIQRFQNKVLRNIVNAPRFIRNVDIHRDLNVTFVTDEIRRFARRHAERLQQHENVEIAQLLDNASMVRRLKRRKPFELV